MWRYALPAIIALALAGVGIASVARGQTLLGITFVGIAVLRLGAMRWSIRPHKPQPSIRLNLEGDADLAGGSEERGRRDPPGAGTE
jgi:hypothetical protein